IGLHTVKVLEDANKGHGYASIDDALLDAPLPRTEIFLSWERLRTFGKLPLFGVSFSALVTIPIVSFLIATYNDQVALLKAHALHEASALAARISPSAEQHNFPASTIDIAEAAQQKFVQIILQIHEIPLPRLTFWLMISTLILGVASALYALFCPP